MKAKIETVPNPESTKYDVRVNGIAVVKNQNKFTAKEYEKAIRAALKIMGIEVEE
jgi:hypothetical protein